MQERYSVSLENFEGPLDFLLYLSQKREIDIKDVRLQLIIDQFLADFHDSQIDLGAEFVGTAASLLWLKSKLLLPRHEQSEEGEEEELDPHFEVIHQLIDYCRFKQMGKKLVILEKEQHAYFPRGVSGDMEVRKPLGIDHLSVEDIALLFREVLERAKAHTGTVHEENFRVADKIRELRKRLEGGARIPFKMIFSPEKPKIELIVYFLAILELMKTGELAVSRLPDSGEIVVTRPEPIGECA